MAEFPHCNSEVLHAPGECFYCDKFPERQSLRLAGGGGFSPAEANGWSGNTAAPLGSVHHHMGASWVVGEDETDPVPDPEPKPKRWWWL